MRSAVAVVAIVVGTVLSSVGVARTDPGVEGWVSLYQVHTGMAAAGLAVLVAGIAILRSGPRESAEVVAVSLSRVAASLDEVVERANALGARLDTYHDTDALHAELDALVAGPVARFVDERQAIIDARGIGPYAVVMGPFAQGERYLNRAWSASTDRHLEESVACVRRAVPELEEARRELQRLLG